MPYSMEDSMKPRQKQQKNIERIRRKKEVQLNPIGKCLSFTIRRTPLANFNICSTHNTLHYFTGYTKCGFRNRNIRALIFAHELPIVVCGYFNPFFMQCKSIKLNRLELKLSCIFFFGKKRDFDAQTALLILRIATIGR